jgi:23S rRNA (cytosine1962-C5)-methyltransferase
MTAILHVKQGRERSILGRHPWVFSGAIAQTEGAPKEGDLVELYSGKKFLGRGFFGDRSICAKILTFEDRSIDLALFRERLASAHGARRSMGLLGRADLNCFRLVHGEGDGLPGLVVDRFGSFASIELHSAGYVPYLEQLTDALFELVPECSTVVATGAGMGEARWLRGNAGQVGETTEVIELGVRLKVPLTGGQKTGYFLDQRSNRGIVQELSRGRSVLDLFSYIGGFGLHAARGGASKVVCVDGSKPAIELVRENAQANKFSAEQLSGVLGDCFEYLKEGSEQFDIVVVDPPAFVKHRAALQSGIRGYQSLNQAAFRRVAPGGLLLTCSCSQLVSEEDFYHAVRTAAAVSGRSTRVMQRLGQAPCHPTSIFHPEGRYLKGLLLQVD